MKSVEEIKRLASKVPFFVNPSVSFLSEGYGNYNYLVQDEGRKYVLRIKKSKETQFKDSLEKEYSFLKYFESQGIKFCPKVFFYDDVDNFLIEEFLEGKEVSQKDFTKSQIDLFARQLHALFRLDVKKFSSFCSENGYKKFGYVNPVDNLKKYGFGRFEEAKKSGLNDAYCYWIESRLNKNLCYLEAQEEDGEVGFAWGDIQSRVIITDDGVMLFYDFEHAVITKSFGLAYIKIHGKFSDQQFDCLVERCAFRFNRTINELLDEIETEERIIRTNDVVWAAMKWAKTKDEKFKNLMLERIKLVED
ncbi:phosphotransferase [Candidatus Kaiserbacteria bacterium]|nr:phosphotransferase [Candidatus Kaiserbacteria bacterium]